MAESNQKSEKLRKIEKNTAKNYEKLRKNEKNCVKMICSSNKRISVYQKKRIRACNYTQRNTSTNVNATKMSSTGPVLDEQRIVYWITNGKTATTTKLHQWKSYGEQPKIHFFHRLQIKHANIQLRNTQMKPKNKMAILAASVNTYFFTMSWYGRFDSGSSSRNIELRSF